MKIWIRYPRISLQTSWIFDAAAFSRAVSEIAISRGSKNFASQVQNPRDRLQARMQSLSSRKQPPWRKTGSGKNLHRSSTLPTNMRTIQRGIYLADSKIFNIFWLVGPLWPLACGFSTSLSMSGEESPWSSIVPRMARTSQFTLSSLAPRP